MDASSNLNLPFIIAAQAQKHVTHNEAVRALDALVQLMVLDKDLASPPGSPVEGSRYIVAASPTGAWSGQAAKVAAYQDGAWAFYAPNEGWLAWVADEDTLYVWSGSAWAEFSGGSSGLDNIVEDTTPQLGGDLDANGHNLGFDNSTGITDDAGNEQIIFHKTASAVNQVGVTNAATGNAPQIAAEGGDTNIDLTLAGKGTGHPKAALFGVNATADPTTKFVVAAAASLFNHVGNGHQHKINKNAAGDTASLLFQTGTSGRAEMGTAGDDDFHFKVSADGSAWTEAILIDKSTGRVSFPATGYLDLPAASAPGTPASGKVRLYAKTDKSLYQKDDAGTETGLAGGGGGTAASQADQETATSTITFVSPGRQQYHPSAAKAWVNMDMTSSSGGVFAIRASYNVSSVTDNATGEGVVNFVTPFSSANYAWSISGSVSTSMGGFTSGPRPNAPTASAFACSTFNPSIALTDMAHASLTFFGDQ